MDAQSPSVNSPYGLRFVLPSTGCLQNTGISVWAAIPSSEHYGPREWLQGHRSGDKSKMSAVAIPVRLRYFLSRFSYWLALGTRYFISDPKDTEDVLYSQCARNDQSRFEFRERIYNFRAKFRGQQQPPSRYLLCSRRLKMRRSLRSGCLLRKGH